MNARPQFRLRTLMIVVSLLCVVFATFAVRLERQRRHRRAVEKLTAIGADVYSQGDAVVVSFFQPEPGCASMDPPTHYYFPATGTLAEFRAEELKYLLDIEGLNCVNFMNAPVGDEVMDYVVKVGHLDSLSLAGTKISDEGIAKLTGLKNLHSLNLCNTRVTDSGVSQLAQLPRLRSLGIRHTSVSEQVEAELCETNPHLQIR